MTTTRITGTAAIEYARANGLTLSTYATALEPDGQDGLTPDQAEEWSRPSGGGAPVDLVYLDVELDRVCAAMIAACPYDMRERSPAEHGVYCIEVDVDANDDEACDAEVARIAAAIGPGWALSWTGDGNGTCSDLEIRWTGEIVEVERTRPAGLGYPVRKSAQRGR